MQIGAIIEKGPKSWQIIQQDNGTASIELSGKYVRPEGVENITAVFTRIVYEETGDSVIKWTRCTEFGNEQWKIKFDDIPAGGLYRIETCIEQDNNQVTEWNIRGDMIHHIGVGDVFVIAGQSNSAGYGKDPVYDPPEIGIHVYRNSGEWDLASHPLGDSTNTIHEVNRDGANTGHSPYLSFAKRVKAEINYPIGLIQSALGGSALSSWDPFEKGELYNSMMSSIQACGGRIKGLLWYQGCSDTAPGIDDSYSERFERMVSKLRSDLDIKDLPVFTVQIGRCVNECDEQANISWGKIREAQRQIPKKMKNVFVVPVLDSIMADGIHISSASNMIIGERLAKAALNKIYAKKYISDAPDVLRAKREGSDGIRITFDNIFGRIRTDMVAKDLPFTVVDEEGKMRSVKHETVGCTDVIIKLPRSLKGKAYIHGAYEMNPGFLIPDDSESRLPMLAFYGVKIE